MRGEKGISQMALAKLIGVTQNSVWRYESGSSCPPVDVLCKYADVFDVSLDWIFGRTEKKEGKRFHGIIRSEKERMRALADDLLSEETEFGKKLRAIIRETFPVKDEVKADDQGD